MVELKPDPLGVEEGQRVVARGPRPLLRCADDASSELDQEGVDRVDVLARAGPKAEVVEAGRGLDVRDGAQAQKRHQPVVEGDALGHPIDPQDHVGDPVDLDRLKRIVGA